MDKVKTLVNDAYKELLEDLKSGDEIRHTGSYDRPLRISKKAEKHRLSFIEKVRTMMQNQTLTTQEANLATNQFGKKTTKIYWCK